MKRLPAIGMLLVLAFNIAGCAHQRDAGWITLFDGTSLDNWTRVGDANSTTGRRAKSDVCSRVSSR